MKVTLANLHEATAQQVFDQVATHLLTQNRKSMGAMGDGEVCAYRGQDALACAAGCLIADDEYQHSWESKTWGTLAALKAVPGNHRGLIGDLQVIHDGFPPDDWPMMLKDVASGRNLNTDVLGKFA